MITHVPVQPCFYMGIFLKSTPQNHWNSCILFSGRNVTLCRLSYGALGDLDTILKMQFSVSFYWLVSLGECNRSLLMISQHWFRYWLGAAIRQYAITLAKVEWPSSVSSQGITRLQWVEVLLHSLNLCTLLATVTWRQNIEHLHSLWWWIHFGLVMPYGIIDLSIWYPPVQWVM